MNAGDDQAAAISDTCTLSGQAQDDGAPSGILTYTWENVSAPEGAAATIASPSKRVTRVSFTTAGIYEFRLKVSDGDLTAEDTVKVTVTEDGVLPEVLARYSFDRLTADGRYVMTEDKADSTWYGRLYYNPKLPEGRDGNGLQMTGKISGGYMELPQKLTKGLSQATISMDVKLAKGQENHTRLLTLGNKFSLEYQGANELVLTVNGNTLTSGTAMTADNWKNIEIVENEDDYSLYVDGRQKGTLKDTGMKLSGISGGRYFVGRGSSEQDAVLCGMVDNFAMYAKALSEDEMKEKYGSSQERSAQSVKSVTVITAAGKAPQMPETVSVLYSDGLYEKEAVKWDAISSSSYQAAGSFETAGEADCGLKVTAKIQVVSGTLQNIAPQATATAIINSTTDLGGVTGLNDGYDPSSSADTSHGAWHNWHGNQTSPAWVCYTWDQPQTITGMDTYFFKDGSGNFCPAGYSLEYLGNDGSWYALDNVQGLGVLTDQYNQTTFDAVSTTAIRMTMTPASLGCGILEWKVYGYVEGSNVDKSSLKAAITLARGLNQKLFSKGMDNVTAALKEAQTVSEDKKATQEETDAAYQKLSKAIAALTPTVKDNIAYIATPSATYCPSWNKVSAVNDGVATWDLVSQDSEAQMYGSWGNESTGETVTYTWVSPMEISSCDAWFWTNTDGYTDGIEIPDSYVYEYLDAQGNWQKVKNADGYKVLQKRGADKEESLKGFNSTAFDKVTTTALRITINKKQKDGNGIGMLEWQVYGTAAKEKKPDQPVTPVNPQTPEKTASGTGAAGNNAAGSTVTGNATGTQTSVQSENAAQTAAGKKAAAVAGAGRSVAAGTAAGVNQQQKNASASRKNSGKRKISFRQKSAVAAGGLQKSAAETGSSISAGKTGETTKKQTDSASVQKSGQTAVSGAQKSGTTIDDQKTALDDHADQTKEAHTGFLWLMLALAAIGVCGALIYRRKKHSKS